MKKTLWLIAGVVLTGLFGTLMRPTVLFGVLVPDMGFLAWIFLVPLLLAHERLGEKAVFFSTFLAAFLFYGGSLYWLVFAMKNFGGLGFLESVGVLLLILIIFSSLAALGLRLARTVSRRTGIPYFLALALFLELADMVLFAFPVGGFPWSIPAYSQGHYLNYFQWIDLTGVLGLNLIIYLVNGLVFEVIHYLFKAHQRERALNRAVIIFILTMLSVFGSLQRSRTLEKGPPNAGMTVALLQGNIAQDMKWNPRLAMSNLQTYEDLTAKAAAQGATLAVWPETAYPLTLDLSDLNRAPLVPAGSLALPVLAGAVSELGSDLEDPLLYNSAFLSGTNARVLALYHKRHLVPFGEYVPGKRFLWFARRLTQSVGDFSPGVEPNVLDHAGLRLGVLICFEDLFPDLARTVVAGGANVLVNITNDAWYGNTSAQYQHLVLSQFRALENRRYLLRATNTGLTAFIDARGEILARLDPFEADLLIHEVHPESRLTFYTRHGSLLPGIVIAFSLALLLWALFIPQKRNAHE